MALLLTILAWCIVGVSLAAGFWFGRSVPFAEQWPMYESLRTTASIIFAVIGAWLAIIYPDRLRISFGVKSNSVSPSLGMSQLFTPVVNSTAILCVILIIGAAVPILRRNPPPVDIELCRGLSYLLLVGLTFWQLWTVILTLIPASEMKASVDQENQSLALTAGRAAAGTFTTDGERPPAEDFANR